MKSGDGIAALTFVDFDPGPRIKSGAGFASLHPGYDMIHLSNSPTQRRHHPIHTDRILAPLQIVLETLPRGRERSEQ